MTARLSRLEMRNRKSVLPNGIRVITEQVPHVRSLALGVWIWSGSRFERPEHHGIAHFLEHMVFKGTATRDAFHIARSIESLGGYLNAFTGRELNCYFVRVLDEHVDVSIEVLSDILQHSVFDLREIEKEKGVVLDEINGMQDAPEELVGDIFTGLVWQPHPLSRPILGTEATVASFTREDLQAYLQTQYQADHIYVIASGNVDHDHLVDLVADAFRVPLGTNNGTSQPLPDAVGRGHVLSKDIAQAHLCVGGMGLPFHDQRKYPLFVLNTALGGGMTSRLFQKIREEAALAYSIYSDVDFCLDTGLFCISAGTDASDVPQVLDMIHHECELLRRNPLSEEELKDAKSQLIGGLLLSQESTVSVMNRLARMEIYLDSYRTIDETVAEIEAVTCEMVQDIAVELLSPERLSVAVIGPVAPDSLPVSHE